MRIIPIDSMVCRRLYLVAIQMSLAFICTVPVVHGSTASAAPRVTPSVIYSHSTPGTVILKGEGFNVMNVQLVLGSRLYFANPSNMNLDLDIDTWRGRAVARITVPEHGRIAWMPKRYGVYDYYDAKTTHFAGSILKNADGEKVYQVVARRHSQTYPVPAYGVVAVTNIDGGGIPLSSQYGYTEVPKGGNRSAPQIHGFMRNGPWLEVTKSTMTFDPWVLVVKADQPVYIYDEDGMDHAFFPGNYPVMYVDRGHLRWYDDRFRGFELHKDGGHRSITFFLPGIHHILCVYHSYPWRHTYKTHHKAGDFPYIMDAVVVVEPDSTSKAGLG